MSSYITVFDFATRLPFGWQVWVLIATIVGITVAIPLRFRQVGRWRAAFIGLFGLMLVIGAAFWSAAIQYAEVARAVAEGRVQVAEGTVTNFAGAERHRPVEAFELGGQQFTYGSGLLPAGYSVTMLWGGRLRDGQRVRVTYYDTSWHERVITKLEVAGDV